MTSLPPNTEPTPPAISAPAPQIVPPAGVMRVSSTQLFAAGSRELHIDHHGVLYRLKQTALGKLILTK
jgi:hemin uptake protein HemP